MIILKEENKDLRGKLFPIPKGVKEHLKKILSDYEEKDGNKNNDGYDRLVYLCGQERITMEELKRIKNFFDNYKGTSKSDDYILNGGKPMSDWINRILKVATDTSKNEKEAKELMGLDDKKQKGNVDHPRIQKLQQDKIQTKNLSNSISKNSTVKESRIIYISENQANLLKEPNDPNTFFPEALDVMIKNRFGINDIIKYCTKHLGEPVGKGLARIVYDIDDNTVLKLDVHLDNTIQTVKEIENTEALVKNGITIIPQIFKKSNYNAWIVCERAVTCRLIDFDHIIGIPFFPRKDFKKPVEDSDSAEFGNYEDFKATPDPYVLINKNLSIEGFMEYTRHNGKYTLGKDSKMYEKLRNKNKWFNQLFNLVNITKSDDLHYRNFGIIKRNGTPTIVVIDLGL